MPVGVGDTHRKGFLDLFEALRVITMFFELFRQGHHVGISSAIERVTLRVSTTRLRTQPSQW